VTSLQQEANTSLHKHSLHHRETLFVVSTSDFEDIALELITKGVSSHFLGNALLVKDAQFFFIIYFDTFARSRGRVRYD
jgi:hypothetical protein